jgi:hypothetical protein
MKFNLGKFLAVVAQIGPVILAATPGGEKIPADLIPKIVGAIGDAQQIKGASGEEKKRHVMSILAAGVDVANATGKVKLDTAEIQAVASTGIDNVVATVKIVQGAKVAVDPAVASAAGVGVEHGGIAGASRPGVDTAQRQTDLGEGHSTHGHGSADNLPPADGDRPADSKS